MSIFDLVLTGVSEIREKILNNNDQIKENANFGHFKAECFLPFISLQKIQLIRDRELIIDLCPLSSPLAGS